MAESTFTISETERRVLLFALAKLSAAGPRWFDLCAALAEKLDGRETWLTIREQQRDKAAAARNGA